MKCARISCVCGAALILLLGSNTLQASPPFPSLGDDIFENARHGNPPTLGDDLWSDPVPQTSGEPGFGDGDEPGFGSGGAGKTGGGDPPPPDVAEDQPCQSDVTGDGRIGLEDLLEVLVRWGPCLPVRVGNGGPGDQGGGLIEKGDCASDLDKNGETGLEDLLLVLIDYGKICHGPGDTK